MYTLCLKKDFIARHQLIGGDWGAENLPHAHHYVVELRLVSDELDRHGYLVDLVDVEERLEVVVGRFADQMLNELPEFGDANPSLERFARIIWDHLKDVGGTIRSMAVRLWENDEAWAEWSGPLS